MNSVFKMIRVGCFFCLMFAISACASTKQFDSSKKMNEKKVLDLVRKEIPSISSPSVSASICSGTNCRLIVDGNFSSQEFCRKEQFEVLTNLSGVKVLSWKHRGYFFGREECSSEAFYVSSGKVYMPNSLVRSIYKLLPRIQKSIEVKAESSFSYYLVKVFFADYASIGDVKYHLDFSSEKKSEHYTVVLDSIDEKISIVDILGPRI